MIRQLLSSMALAAAAALMATGVSAGTHSEEPDPGIVTAEILPGWDTARGTHMAGLRIRLAPGWKTYWRAPGDAGIPPRLNWDGSENMAAARIYWPRPEVFRQNGMRSIGYKHEVVLPVELTPSDPSRGMRVEVKLELGVCLDICVPTTLELAADLPAKPQPEPIRKALAQQPLPARKAGVGQVTCSAEPLPDGLRLTTRIEMPNAGSFDVAVIELADASIWVSEAEVSHSSGRLIAVSDLVPVTAAPFALDRSNVRITLLSGNKAVDIQGCTGG